MAMLFATAAATAQEVKIDAETFGGLEARSIGPAVMSGRIAAIDAVPSDRWTIYVGSASGGLWKSSDGGFRFKPVFDKNTQSIGAIAIDQANPATVWVGTGETWVRNSVSVGDGLYKTTDGGDSWTRVGLEDSERIAQVRIDPANPDTVYACATGHLWNANPQRGVFKTTDGGKTWQKVLSVDDNTGCADLAIDPQDGRILYAAMWQFRRSPDFFTSGGPGGGLFKSTDGGATWRKLAKGLPTGDLGRIAVAVAPSRPSVVYATVEAKKTALYRSDDLGESWTEMNSSSNVTGRPFYFSRLVVDPTDFNRVYKPGYTLTFSTDGGKTFSGAGQGGDGAVHPDHHALWINPRNPEQMLIGTDGGVYESRDRANNWRLIGSLPVAQFYHVSYDMLQPYNVYGGLQDNGSWVGPSRTNGAITARHWKVLGGGDGFWAFVDPKDQDTAYVEYQGGNLLRVTQSTGETKEVKPLPREGEPEYRFNWNTPIHLSPTRVGTLYYGSQFLFRSTDKGETWERISPDLTTNDPAKQRQEESGGLTVDNSSAENHCTIFSISESPKNKDVIWAGTDDGNLQVTRDGGKTWTNVSGKVTGLPKGTWVSRVEAGRFAEGTAYATFDGHMTGDMVTHVYRTKDHGATWQSLATDEVRGYAHVIVEDLVNPDLLFLGTESGLFVSVDGGKQWGQFTGGLPNVAVRDLAIHPRESDLLIATHGRGIYILDDLTPLRKLTSQVVNSDVAFLESRPSTLIIPAGEQRFDGGTEFEGRSPEEAAFITYYFKKRHMFGDLKLEIYDSKGTLVSTLPGGKRRGINRVAWPMRLTAPKVPKAASLVPNFFSFVGPRVPDGTYTVKMIKGKET
ncbi:MAG TPA: glycosyl hydrolase, partial [Candidatus Polarisedimenticolia bacterium]|nr:glycosyl hydrolase [Candidatus Polarisedimenticolia bacterium]